MLGGIPEGSRELLTPEDDSEFGAFEQMVDRTIGDRVRADKDAANELWGSLANVDWGGPNGMSVGYSFRAAGDLVAALRKDDGKMTYMNYYCSVDSGYARGWIEEALNKEGWIVIEEVNPEEQ